jgi:hypothetical protein
MEPSGLAIDVLDNDEYALAARRFSRGTESQELAA